jgi:hypothetical protein
MKSVTATVQKTFAILGQKDKPRFNCIPNVHTGDYVEYWLLGCDV